MSLNLEQTDGTEGTDLAPPQPCKPKDPSSPIAVADPSFSSSRRVTLCINPRVLMRFPEQRSDRLRRFERRGSLTRSLVCSECEVRLHNRSERALSRLVHGRLRNLK